MFKDRQYTFREAIQIPPQYTLKNKQLKYFI